MKAKSKGRSRFFGTDITQSTNIPFFRDGSIPTKQHAVVLSPEGESNKINCCLNLPEVRFFNQKSIVEKMSCIITIDKQAKSFQSYSVEKLSGTDTIVVKFGASRSNYLLPRTSCGQIFPKMDFHVTHASSSPSHASSAPSKIVGLRCELSINSTCQGTEENWSPILANEVQLGEARVIVAWETQVWLYCVDVSYLSISHVLYCATVSHL